MEVMKLPTESTESWLSSIKSAVGIDESDHEIESCATQLRKIYEHNESRIKAMESNTNLATTTDERDRKRVCRAATPSPTPDDEPNANVTCAAANTFQSLEDVDGAGAHSGAEQTTDDLASSQQRKRQRYET